MVGKKSFIPLLNWGSPCSPGTHRENGGGDTTPGDIWGKRRVLKNTEKIAKRTSNLEV